MVRVPFCRSLCNSLPPGGKRTNFSASFNKRNDLSGLGLKMNKKTMGPFWFFLDGLTWFGFSRRAQK